MLPARELDDLRERLFRGRADPYGVASRLLEHIEAMEQRLTLLQEALDAAGVPRLDWDAIEHVRQQMAAYDAAKGGE
jgi:hypothetical protein